MKSYLKFIIFAVFIAFLQIPISTTAAPIRLCTLPIIIAKNTEVSSDTLAQMQVKIARSLFVPLNGTLNKVEYIPSNQSTDVLQEIWSGFYNTNRMARLSDTLKPLAQRLNADIVVCTVLYNCNQMTSMTFERGTHLVSNAGVEMMIFDNRTGRLTNRKITRNYNDDYSQYGTADALALDCLTKLIDELELRKRVLNYD